MAKKRQRSRSDDEIDDKLLKKRAIKVINGAVNYNDISSDSEIDENVVTFEENGYDYALFSFIIFVTSQ